MSKRCANKMFKPITNLVSIIIVTALNLVHNGNQNIPGPVLLTLVSTERPIVSIPPSLRALCVIAIILPTPLILRQEFYQAGAGLPRGTKNSASWLAIMVYSTLGWDEVTRGVDLKETRV